MCKPILYLITVSMFLLCFGKAPASAFSLDYLMTVEVPFEFQVNDQTMPAGRYVIKRDPQIPNLLQLHNREQRVSFIVHTHSLELADTSPQSGLRFNGYGDRHFLSEIRVAGRGVKYALSPSKAESKLAQLAKAKDFSALPQGSPSQR